MFRPSISIGLEKIGVTAFIFTIKIGRFHPSGIGQFYPALNGRFCPPLTLDDNLTPVCLAGVPMYHDGYDIQRCRTKYRCPLVMGKIKFCPFIEECSFSANGRTVYVNDNDDIRMFGPVPYCSDKWKKLYKNRTSAEQINNRVLNDYHLHQMKIRGYAKVAFFAIFAGINTQLDTWTNN